MNDLLAMGAIVALAVIDWTATARRWMRLRYLTKPAVLLALLAWFVLAGLSNGFLARSQAASWFATGLFFSLLGDILLMIPRNYFLGGLASFLAAHLAYIISFNFNGNPPLGIPQGFLVLAVSAWALFYYTRIRVGLARYPGSRRLPLAVALYSLVITWMLLSALLTLFRPEWRLTAAGLVSLGGLLFFSSDSILAYDRFVRALPRGRLLVIVTYHIGQFALAAGMVSHMLSG